MDLSGPRFSSVNFMVEHCTSSVTPMRFATLASVPHLSCIGRKSAAKGFELGNVFQNIFDLYLYCRI
jgi:hypothetical protein